MKATAAKRLLIFILISGLSFGAHSQFYPVSVTVQLAPPYSGYISDYKAKPIISFRNNGQQPYDVYIRGRMQNDRGDFIQTKPNVYSNTPVHVPAFQTVVVQGLQLDESYLDLDNLQTNLSDQAYANLFQLGLMPEGFYTYCIYAYVIGPNGNYVAASDPQAPGTCFPFNLGYVAPPVITSPFTETTINPTPNQNVNISWTRPVGNLQNASLVYDLYMVKVLDGENPEQTLNNAVQYGAGIFLKQEEIPINNFQFSNLSSFSLETGSRYALMVQARDRNGKTAFENNGRSKVEIFRYGADQPPMAIAAASPPLVSAANCSCVSDLSSEDKINNNASLKAGDHFTMASLTVQIGSITPTGSTVSGDGSVLINGVPVLVDFSGVVVNKNGVAIEGTASGRTANGFDFLKNAGSPTISSTNYNSFIDQIKNYNLSALKNGIGLPLPFGLNSIGAPDAVNIGVVALNLTPKQASYDAIAVIQLADANNVLSLLAKQVCFSNASLMCGDALFVLGKDFQVPAINLNFKSYQSDADPGTYVLYSKSEMKQFQIHAEYIFPVSQLTSADGGQVRAVLKAEATNWSDWTATVTMDPFKIPALDNALFTLKTGAFYDHSTLRNPAGMPTSFSDAALAEKNAAIGSPLWTGFFIPSISVSLPALVKDTRRADDKLEIAATNLVIDKGGITGVVGANNVVGIGDGSLGGWYCSLDQISIKFLNSSYKEGGLYGKVILPFSDKNNAQSQIDYSCTLSAGKDGGGLTYQFVAKQKSDIDFSAWWAKININNCSISVTNAGGNTVAAANLSGKLNIEGDIGGFKASLKLIEIEELQVQTQAPYVKVKNAVMGFSSPQHSFSGFPISITDLKPDISGNSAGLKFDFGLNLSDISNDLLPKAVTTLKIGANILPGNRGLWERMEIKPERITVSGNLAGIVHIEEGFLEFYHDDPIFGNGVQGGLKASFAGFDKITIETNVKFGNTTFNYWYFDASATFPGVPVAPGFSINGFGGGAFYNLVKSPVNENLSPKDYFKNKASYSLGAYTPKSGMLGFKAKVAFCSSDGFLFSGYGELGVTFDIADGISLNAIDGTLYAQLLNTSSGVSVNDNAPIKGQIDLHLGIADKVFSLNGMVDIQATVLEGSGRFAILADAGNDNYYIKLGQPDNRISVTALGLATLTSYFMAGNQIDASIPDPDPEIIDVSKLAGYKKLQMVPGSGGMVFGANLKIAQELNFLIFYIKASAGLGFDISLARYSEPCEGSSKPPGIDGWYALGQVYAGIKGEFGLQVDLFFFSGRVKALELDASVLMRGGLPNPYWFEGYARLAYSVLDDAISGEVNFKVSIGDKCVPPTQVFTQPLIADLKPEDQTVNVPLNAYVEANFNYPVEKEFQIVVTDGEGIDQVRNFRIQIKDGRVTNTANGQIFANYSDSRSYPSFADDHNKNLSMSPDDAMEPQTQYAFQMSVKAQENKNNKWEDSYYKGAVVEETKSVAFKTGECKLDEFITSKSSRIGAYPFPGQRYFLQGDSKQGAIILDRDYACAASGSTKDYELLVRFTAFKNKIAVASFEKPVILNGSKYLKFDIPTLPNESIIRVEVIKRMKLTTKDAYTLYKSDVALSTTMNKIQATAPSGTISMKATSYNSLISQAPKSQISTPILAKISQTLKLKEKHLDIILYKYHFRTSRYNTLADKLKGIFFDQVKGYFLTSPLVEMRTIENFDVYDVTGFASEPYQNGNEMFFTAPLAIFKETSDYNKWLKNYALPCVYEPYLKAGITLQQARVKAGLTYKQIQQEGDACSLGGVYCVPLRPIEVSGYAQPLSKQEIDAEDPDIRIIQVNNLKTVSITSLKK